MKLHLGLMSNKDLAKWFGITYNTLSKYKDKKLKELEAFAEFHVEKKKVYIDKIYEEEYSNCKTKAKELVEKNFNNEWGDNGLDTCSHLSKVLKNKLGDELSISEETTRHYALEARKKFYGTPCLTPGELGKCSYIWCKKVEEGNNVYYDFLTEEEEIKKKEILKKYFGEASEKQVIVQGMIERGEINKEDAWEVLDNLTNTSKKFYSFLQELRCEIGATVVRGTLLDKSECIIER